MHEPIEQCGCGGVITICLVLVKKEIAMEGIEKLERESEEADREISVSDLLAYYRDQYPKPVFRLVEDIERQALLYANIIDQVKRGDDTKTIRSRFENLLPGAALPNPDIPALFQKALDKLSRSGRHLSTS